MSTHVTRREGESFESLLSRFVNGVKRSGILRDYRAHEYFVGASEQRREAERKARRRHLRRQARAVARAREA